MSDDRGKLYESEGVAEYVLTLFDEDFKGVCIDVGAYHSRWLSNSYPFEELDWLVWCIEPNPNCEEYLAERPHVSQYAMGARNENNVDFYIYNIGHGLNGQAGGTSLLYNRQFDKDFKVMETVKVDVRTLDWFLENVAEVEHVDFLSIDTEGTELDVLEGIDLARWNVKVIAIENLYGRDEIPDYLTSRGYKRVVEGMIFNEIYIKEIENG
jgi:FkbM family methyltransferase